MEGEMEGKGRKEGERGRAGGKKGRWKETEREREG